MKDDIIGICYTISVIPSSIILYVALTKCIIKLLLFTLIFLSLYICLTKCYLSIRYSSRAIHIFYHINFMIEQRNRFIRDVDLNEATSLTHMLDRHDKEEEV